MTLIGITRIYISSFGITNKFLGHVRNINYESKNEDLYKDDPTSEIFGAAGLLSSINLEKNINQSIHTFNSKSFFKVCFRKYEKRDFWFKTRTINSIFNGQIKQYS